MRTTTFRAVLVLLTLASAALAQPQSRWAPFGPGGGTPQGLAVDPRNPAVVYAATGTLYRSADGGETWKALFGPNLTAVAVDLVNPSTIYAGGRQLARSTDGGRTWQATLFAGNEISSLAVVAGRPSTVLAAAGNQLLYAEGGLAWSAIFVEGVVLSVVADPSSPRTAYYTDLSGVHKSTDAGKTWFLSGPLVSGQPASGFLGASGGTLYLATGGPVFRSDDGARSWRQTGSAPTSPSITKAFLVDPGNPSRLYLAGYEGLFRSDDAGAGWTRLTGGLPQLPLGETLAFFALAVAPSRSGFLYAGAYERGVAKSVDGGANWHIGVEPGLSDGPVALLKIHPGRPDASYVGLATRGDRAFRSTDGGRTWQGFARRVAREGMLDLGFDLADPDTLYLGNEKGLWKSGDGGAGWSRISTGTFYRVAVSTPGTLVAGRDCGLSRSTDDGQTWKQVIPCFIGDDLTVFAASLWVDPDAPRNLYALMVATNGASGFDRFLARSTDGGATWKNLMNRIAVLAVAPGDFQTLYAVDFVNQSIRRSTDGGQSWRTVHDRTPYPDSYSALAVDATDPDTLYVGTAQKGVLRSRDGGATLKPLGAPFEGSRRAVKLLLTDRGHPGVVWAALLNGGLFWGRFE